MHNLRFNNNLKQLQYFLFVLVPKLPPTRVFHTFQRLRLLFARNHRHKQHQRVSIRFISRCLLFHSSSHSDNWRSCLSSHWCLRIPSNLWWYGPRQRRHTTKSVSLPQNSNNYRRKRRRRRKEKKNCYKYRLKKSIERRILARRQQWNIHILSRQRQKKLLLFLQCSEKKDQKN